MTATPQNASSFPQTAKGELGGIIYLRELIESVRNGSKEVMRKGYGKAVLEFLCLSPQQFETLIRRTKTDEEVLIELRARLGAAWPSDYAIAEFNTRCKNRQKKRP
ncbi:MAG: DUF5069 domain-containing protein [Methylacidiphilales bacterium]|nr:DUF5069 domain-containing protein [Candidatus Methylacidiphilales bacterium]MDW8349757.1 hypothetical protein [Verrucomicrobiae bacterium]